MKIVMFYHSLISDWNHGNAHFLRGTASEFIIRGYEVEVWEGENSWSRMNLISDYGKSLTEEFKSYYPLLTPRYYNEEDPQLEAKVKDANIVIVHEWNRHEIVAALGELKKRFSYKLYFHDTHHRSVTEEHEMSNYDLREYDGIIAFGNIIRDRYIDKGWSKSAWTIHEAADTTVFYPRNDQRKEGDLVWIGNWGDEERSEEIREFLIRPAKDLKLKCTVYGVRYPDYAKDELKKAGISYRGWLPNYKVPEVFGRHTLTMHIPRGPYIRGLPGIPTIRPFEAMACGIPLVSAPWNDSENLFTPGKDFLFAADGNEMKNLITELLNNRQRREYLISHALKTIRTKHTCEHRVDQFCRIFEETDINELTDING
jgi:spore maturation protein CgeB